MVADVGKVIGPKVGRSAISKGRIEDHLVSLREDGVELPSTAQERDPAPGRIALGPGAMRPNRHEHTAPSRQMAVLFLAVEGLRPQHLGRATGGPTGAAAEPGRRGGGRPALTA